jgi:hypothetical protein
VHGNRSLGWCVISLIHAYYVFVRPPPFHNRYRHDQRHIFIAIGCVRHETNGYKVEAYAFAKKCLKPTRCKRVSEARPPES